MVYSHWVRGPCWWAMVLGVVFVIVVLVMVEGSRPRRGSGHEAVVWAVVWAGERLGGAVGGEPSGGRQILVVGGCNGGG